MSTSSSAACIARDPSSTAVRSNFERLQIVATAVPCVGFLIISTLHVTMSPRSVGPGLLIVHMILFYCASLLIGGLLSDSGFNSRNPFLITVAISSVLTTILPLLTGNLNSLGVSPLDYNIENIMEFMPLLTLDVIAWLAAAKCIKKCTVPPSRQRLWWTLLTACTSTNIPLMMLTGFRRQPNVWNILGVGALLLLLPLSVGCIIYCNNQPILARNNDREIHKVMFKQLCQVFFSVRFWFIVVLNTLLIVTKWTITMTNPLLGTRNEGQDIVRMKVFGGEIGIVVIGALSAWLIHTGKLMRRETLLYAILFMLSFVLGVLIGFDRDIHNNVHLLVEFFVSFMSDGLILLTTWELMEVVPETVSGTALGLSTACSSGMVLSLPFIILIVYDEE